MRGSYGRSNGRSEQWSEVMAMQEVKRLDYFVLPFVRGNVLVGVGHWCRILFKSETRGPHHYGIFTVLFYPSLFASNYDMRALIFIVAIIIHSNIHLRK
jgi:hypothetical protein